MQGQQPTGPTGPRRADLAPPPDVAARPAAPPDEAAPPADIDAAPASALARARAVARAKGLRPGVKPMRRRLKDLPADVRRGRADSGRDPMLIGDEVDALIATRGWKVDVAAGSVMGRWPQIVGPELASHCHPVSFELGVLVVRAESTAWATQLRLLSSSLMARLEAEAGAGVVTELTVVGPSAPSWSRGPRRVSDGRGPRDTYG